MKEKGAWLSIQPLLDDEDAVEFNDPFSNVASLRVAGDTMLNISDLATTGVQDHRGTVTFGATDTDLAGSTVRFGSAVSATGAQTLTVTGNADFESTVSNFDSVDVTGNASFGDAVGGPQPITPNVGSLSVGGTASIAVGSMRSP